MRKRITKCSEIVLEESKVNKWEEKKTSDNLIVIRKHSKMMHSNFLFINLPVYLSIIKPSIGKIRVRYILIPNTSHTYHAWDTRWVYLHNIPTVKLKWPTACVPSCWLDICPFS